MPSIYIENPRYPSPILFHLNKARHPQAPSQLFPLVYGKRVFFQLSSQ